MKEENNKNRQQTIEAKNKRDWQETVKALVGKLHLNSKGWNTLMLLENDKNDPLFWEYIVKKTNLGLKPCTFSELQERKDNGKSFCMRFKDDVCKEIIICRDADNAHLYENSDKDYLEKPFIYHTYVYDRENHLIENLNKICEDLTGKFFDFSPLIKSYSEIIFPLLLIWFHAQDENFAKFYGEKMQWKSLKKYIILKLGNQWESLNYEKMLDLISSDLKIQIENYILEVKNAFFKQSNCSETAWQNQINLIAQELEKQFINKYNAIAYFNGHITIKLFIKPIFIKKLQELGLLDSQKETYKKTIDNNLYENPFVAKIREKLEKYFKKKPIKSSK